MPNYINLTHRHDLEIEDILQKLQQVTQETSLPQDLAEQIQYPASFNQDSESERDRFYEQPKIQKVHKQCQSDIQNFHQKLVNNCN